MDSIKIILPFCPSSNMAYPTIMRGRKPVRVKSGKLKDWLKKCPSLKHFRKFDKCTISYLLFPPDNRVRDGQSYMKLPLDYIVEQGILTDDNTKIVKGEQWFLGGVDKENPRIEITIKEMK